MDALGSPLEALALNYLTYGFLTVVNSMWAWVAVITAAVSFWRIRALSPPELRGGSRCQHNAASTSSDTAATEDMGIVSSAGETVQFSSAPTSKTFCRRVLERECSMKTKFSLYYEVEGEDFREDDGGDGDGEDNRSDVAAAAEMRSGELDYFRPRRCDEWERVMVVKRMGDMGWYRWQDMTVLDGSVVRLWEGRRRRC